MCSIMGKKKTDTVKGTSMGIRISNQLGDLKQTTYLWVLILRVEKQREENFRIGTKLRLGFSLTSYATLCYIIICLGLLWYQENLLTAVSQVGLILDAAEVTQWVTDSSEIIQDESKTGQKINHVVAQVGALSNPLSSYLLTFKEERQMLN